MIRTTAGRVRGFVDGDLQVFRGIRYGADTAPRRFLPPLAARALARHRRCARVRSRLPAAGRGAEPAEDCLFLNVLAPARDGARPRPVMVYIHGGAYSSGSGSSPLYDGSRLCRRGDVVVVTVNHRLNVFGYLYLAGYLPGFPDSGNAGLLDLVLALQLGARQHRARSAAIPAASRCSASPAAARRSRR